MLGGVSSRITSASSPNGTICCSCTCTGSCSSRSRSYIGRTSGADSLHVQCLAAFPPESRRPAHPTARSAARARAPEAAPAAPDPISDERPALTRFMFNAWRRFLQNHVGQLTQRHDLLLVHVHRKLLQPLPILYRTNVRR